MKEDDPMHFIYAGGAMSLTLGGPLNVPMKKRVSSPHLRIDCVSPAPPNPRLCVKRPSSIDGITCGNADIVATLRVMFVMAMCTFAMDVMTEIPNVIGERLGH